MVPRFDPAKVLANASRAETEDLLDRVTVFREAMEADALDIITAELARRGIRPEEIIEHERQLKHRIIKDQRGLPARCSFCNRAAVESAIGWHKLWRLLPLFRREFYYCDRHWAERSKC
jgi:hypothetical protein